MIIWIPGYYQLSQKKFIQGFFIFFITCFSILLFFKSILFDWKFFAYQEYFFACLFLTGTIWHMHSMVLLHTSKSHLPLTPEELYEKGRMAFMKKNYELSLIYFDSLLKINSNDEDVIYQLSKTHMKLGHKTKTIFLVKNYLKSSGQKWQHEMEDIYEEIIQK